MTSPHESAQFTAAAAGTGLAFAMAMTSSLRASAPGACAVLLLLLAPAGCGDDATLGESSPEQTSRGIAVACDGAFLRQERPRGGTWSVFLKREGAGAVAQDLIFNSAERHAFEASQAGDGRPRDFYWMNASLPKAQNEYLFFMLTAFGGDIVSTFDYSQGRSMTNDPAGSLFRADATPTDGGQSLRFVLRTTRGRFRTSGGSDAPCALASSRSNDCVVQEFVFRGCRFE
jgi:hypothetical protein